MKETKQNLLSKPDESKQIMNIFKNLEWDTNTALKQCHDSIHVFIFPETSIIRAIELLGQVKQVLLGQVYNGPQNTRLHHAIIDQMERYTNPHLIKIYNIPYHIIISHYWTPPTAVFICFNYLTIICLITFVSFCVFLHPHQIVTKLSGSSNLRPIVGCFSSLDSLVLQEVSFLIQNLNSLNV